MKTRWMVYLLCAVGLGLVACQGTGGGARGASDARGGQGDEPDGGATDGDHSDAQVAPEEVAAGDPVALTVQPVQEITQGDFMTSPACALCHDNDSSQAMRDGAGRPVAPFELWQSTMMANAARDPFWRAMVSAEIARAPSLKDAIEDKCTRCHAPMGSVALAAVGGDMALERLPDSQDPVGELMADGVSCTVCHQIQPENLGSPESFSGGYQITGDRVIYGPHADPFTTPMEHHTVYQVQTSEHLRSADLCATCHTLFTDAVDAQGEALGEVFPEQTPYLEWRSSDFSRGEAPTTCQSCHVPTQDEDGQDISTWIAHRPPGGLFPPTQERSPYGRHLFVGGNTRILEMLNQERDILQPQAPAAAFEATIEATRRQLSQRTAQVQLQGVRQEGGALRFSVQVSSMAGHKLPTGFPSRRAWLQVRAWAGQELVWASGLHDEAGRILGQGGQVLPSEQPGGGFLPHFAQISSPDQVQIYEAVMSNDQGEPTATLLRATGYLKDNRLLPQGFSPSPQDAPHVNPVGVEQDADFMEGGDTVAFDLEVGQEPVTRLEVALVYQGMGARFMAELFTVDTAEVAGFKTLYERSQRAPESLSVVTWEP